MYQINKYNVKKSQISVNSCTLTTVSQTNVGRTKRRRVSLNYVNTSGRDIVSILKLSV